MFKELKRDFWNSLVENQLKVENYTARGEGRKVLVEDNIQNAQALPFNPRLDIHPAASYPASRYYTCSVKVPYFKRNADI